MNKKTTLIDELAEDMKSTAKAIGHVIEGTVPAEPEKKLYERVVPIPHVKVHRQLPYNANSPDSASADTAGGHTIAEDGKSC